MTLFPDMDENTKETIFLEKDFEFECVQLLLTMPEETHASNITHWCFREKIQDP